MDRETGLAILAEVIADCLDRPVTSITATSRLVDDLGADSLDFIDLLFTLEKRFGVGLREGELGFLTRLDFSDPAVMRDGYLTAETVGRLAAWLPAIERVGDSARVAPAQLFSLITVEAIWRMLERRLTAARQVSA